MWFWRFWAAWAFAAERATADTARRVFRFRAGGGGGAWSGFTFRLFSSTVQSFFLGWPMASKKIAFVATWARCGAPDSSSQFPDLKASTWRIMASV